MKKNIKVVLAVTCLFLAFSSTASAWSYSNYNYGSYVPKSGSGMQSTFLTGSTYQLDTWVYFQFDSHNVANILDYNNGNDNPGTACDNKKAYVTIDQTAIPDSWDLEIDAYYVNTNLPNPKIDIEDNNFFGENDESEVTVLGTVEADTLYYMETVWNDYRDGDSGDSGKIQAQFAMSTKGLSDYNNCVQSSVVQHTFTYGDNLGIFSSSSPLISTFESLPTENTAAISEINYIDNYAAKGFDPIAKYEEISKDVVSFSKFVKESRDNLSALDDSKIDDIAVTVSFPKAVSFEVLSDFVKKHNITIEQIHARGIDVAGDRLTFAIKGLKEVVLNEQHSDVNFKGYINLQGHINSESIAGLLKDQLAYVVDASGDDTFTGEQDVFAHPVSWLLEDIGDKPLY